MSYLNEDGHRYDLRLSEASHLRNAQILTLMRTIVDAETPAEAQAVAARLEAALQDTTPAGMLQLHDIGAVLRRFADQRIAVSGGVQAMVDAAVLTGELVVVDPAAAPRLATDEDALQDAVEDTDE